MSLIRQATPSYAFEELNHSLTALSTIPISIPISVLGNSETGEVSSASGTIERALRDLSTSKPITRKQLEGVLQTLVDLYDNAQAPTQEQGYGQSNAVTTTPIDKVREAQIMARAVTVVWREILDDFMQGALALEHDLNYWQTMIDSRRDIGLYFVQSLPLRVYRLLPNPLKQSAFRIPSMADVQVTRLFRQASPKTALSSLRDLPLPAHNPFTLTRREVLASIKILRKARNEAAEKIGFLASRAPRWEDEAGRTTGSEDNLQVIVAETSRLHQVVCSALDVPIGPAQPARQGSPSPLATPSKRNKNGSSGASRRETASPPPPPSLTAATLLPILRSTLPASVTSLTSSLQDHGRPSRLTRLWIPLLLLPPLIKYGSRTARQNQDWIRSQIQNAGETVRGWVVGWVVQPLEGVVQTLKGGGEGLGVAPDSVKSDQASLERMVLDLGKDYYHLSDQGLSDLSAKVKAGNMEDVLKVYESEMRSPVKNAVMGNLIRTLLIQVQKTKYDLSLSLLSLDHLLRSQQLTFAFVGLAPSLLILYGLGGWTKRLWTGERRGSGRRMDYLRGIRDVEKLLITAPRGEKEMSDKDRGLLILAVGNLRKWAAGLRTGDRAAFVDDLRLLEAPSLEREGKLRVIDRIWRTSVLNGRKLGM
ncbi:ATP synthase regulation protein NCA2-domain-containing protein [Filobasidium floriforme]|uniref:ATP synthase regulation protein NCA2-domain-containing protein n=1 Tax=Filobasidium floriforme TaxID=5210 RepID=UPI001E8DA263|nr:ATP synthase regulation protein NCA2-domain-containing protein [Filobasidium floriforme]KAH8090542.1 ATP synthase regulation protein NCA2-domain-containing protein [Filobasidium floriforme]